MTAVGEVSAEDRDRWRHDLNCAAHRLAIVREALGVLGAVPGKGSLEGLAADLELASRQVRNLQVEVAAELRVLKGRS